MRASRTSAATVLFLPAAFALVGCGTGSPSFTSADTSTLPGQSLQGIASYYAEEFDGRTTANGEKYDMHALTAAHRSLPFHARVKVTNLDNGKSVIVRINDRGPFKGGRIIDVSYAAAVQLGMISNGTAKVKLSVLSTPGR